MPEAAPAELKADHPFLLILRDTRSRLILFMGRVQDPGPASSAPSLERA
jgi:serine protease inhibitor